MVRRWSRFALPISSKAVGGVLLALVLTPAFASNALAASYREVVEGTSGLAHFWPMGESSGSSFADVTGGDNAAIVGGVTLGQPGGLLGEASATAALFNGTSGAAHATVNLSGTKKLTIEFWMKWKAFAGNNDLAMEFTPNFNEHPGGFLIDPDATPGTDFSFAIGQTSANHNNNVLFERPSAEQWHYYAFVVNTEASGEAEITPYVDGRAVSYTKAKSQTGAGAFASSTLYWMSRNASTLFGAGAMQDLALYETTLSASTILEHYEIANGPPHALFSSTPVQATVGVPVTMNGSESSAVGGITDYAWDFDGSKSYGADSGASPTVSHTFSSTGTYTVDLRVRDGVGETATVSHTITVAAALGAYEQAVEDTSGVAHFWPMGESSGWTFSDAFGGANAELSTSGVTLGQAGGLVADAATAALFNGSSGGAHAAVNLSATKKLTIEFWMQWKAFAANDDLALEFTPNFNEHPGGFLVDPNATPGTSFSVAVGQTSTSHNNNSLFVRPSAEQWHYYAFVINTEASGESEIIPYVDGSAVSYTKGKSQTGAGAFANSTLYWMSRDASTLFGAGEMQDLALYETTLSAATIQRHHELGMGAPTIGTAPSISGTAQDGQTLSAGTGTWNGARPLTYAYQWQRCNAAGESCSNISGATGSTYLLSHGEVGSTIRVTVTATNTAGSASSESAATALVAPAAPSNTSAPSISGTPADGQTLSAGAGSWSGTPPISYAYQWQSCNGSGGECQDIEGATDSSYTVNSTDIETTLRVRVTATNATGSASASSTVTSAVAQGEPRELEAPSVAGAPGIGQPLSAEPGVWSGTGVELSYQWQRCDSSGTECHDLAGAIEQEYVSAEAEVGDTLRVRVGARNELGSVSALSAATTVVGPASLTLAGSTGPSLSGTLQEGQTLTVSPGAWTGVEPIVYTYAWERCDAYESECEERPGGHGSSYALKAEDAGHAIRALVTTTDANGSLTRAAATEQPVAAAPGPLDTQAPSVAGAPVEGQTLHATTGAWSGTGTVGYAYQWQRCREDGEECAAIAGATSASYTLLAGDVGSAVRVLVTASDEAGSSQGVSVPTPAIGTPAPLDASLPSISGAGEVGEPLSANAGIWSGEGAVSFSYQWRRCSEAGEECSNISGATGETYVPSEADAGKTVKAVVTAKDPSGSASATSMASAPIASTPVAPSDVLAPSVEGALTEGDTLTAAPGTWYGSEPISYAYRWQRCDEGGEECANISGATGETYVLAEADVGATVRVVVTATNSAGSESAESSTGETIDAPGPPAAGGEGPAIRGEGQVGQRLFAENGSWSGSRPLLYSYRWERCDAAGEACTAIEGATSPSHTAASADANKTLRVAVTASNTLGRAAALSPTVAIAASGEASTTAAIELAEHTDPSVLQPSTGATLEEQEVKPAVSDEGEELVAASALTSSSTSKETPGEFAVNTSNGELSVSPVGTQPGATKLPTIVNDTAAVYAQTFTATDTIVRPEALGAATLLQLRSSEAPRAFSWEVDLGADQYLESLPNGEVAVVESAPETYFEEPPGEPFESSAESTEAGEGEGVPGEVAEEELEGSGEEGILEELPAAPHASTPEVAPRSGELHPQDTEEQYEHGSSAMEYAQTHTEERTLMVFQAPTVIDAAGETVSASLSSEGETVTLTISPGEGASYPITAQTAVSAPTNTASAAKPHTVRHGLSDPKPESFTTTDEEGKSAPGFDTRLKTGPIHVGTARLVLSYNVPPSNKKLREWLKDVGKDHLQPYITLGECEAAEGYPPCPSTKPPTTKMYEKSIKKLMSKLDKEDASEGIPRVSIWGAWNEPDNGNHPMINYPVRAAHFWQIAQKVANKISCNCKVIAGEFLRYDSKYISKYINTIVTNHKYWAGKPHIWGLHDYSDLMQFHETHRNPNVEAFLRVTNRKRLGHPHIWLSELGVQLQGNREWTPLVGHPKWQSEAAEDFLKIGKEHDRIEREYYYLYRGPTRAEIKGSRFEHAFDSAFFPGEGVTKEGPGEKYSVEAPRPAYCVLVLGEKMCKPHDKTLSAIGSTISPTSGHVAAVVDPGGSPTTYWIEYGTTTAYGQSTSPAATTGTEGEQSEAVALSGLKACTTYHYQVAAENEASEGVPSLGGDKEFTTACAATAVSAGWQHACADLADGRVACWGADEQGDLGDGSFTGPERCSYFADMCSWAPEPVEGITDAIGVAAGDQQSCALLSDGEVECWGEAAEIENTATPVPIAGVTKATAITVGLDFGCALIAGGSVECWGYNSDGQLGDGSKGSSIDHITGMATSVKVDGITDVIAISAGYTHVCAVLADGKVDCWGSNSDGQLGDGTYAGPEECSEEACSTTPVAVEGITDAMAVGVGVHQSCAVLAGGEVYCWGENGWGQLGDGTSTGPQECHYARCSMTPVKVESLSGATAVSGGDAHTCAVLLTGGVECWGSGGSGQLGAGPSIFNSNTPVPASGIGAAETISLGEEFSCALLSGGEIDCWGDNLRGELGGHKSEEASYVPLPVEGIG